MPAIRATSPIPSSGAIAATFQTPVLTSTATYWVRIENACGSIDSEAATVNVITTCTPPSIAVEPQDRKIPTGTRATLEVRADGTGLSPASGIVACRETSAIPKPTRPRWFSPHRPSQKTAITGPRSRGPVARSTAGRSLSPSSRHPTSPSRFPISLTHSGRRR
ncbi:MAG: hypothetical protein MZV64_30475 [Ignavibacteriales bacterium]|nr:hypothetical protein [Ignavibacteriales bacterium]